MSPLRGVLLLLVLSGCPSAEPPPSPTPAPQPTPPHEGFRPDFEPPDSDGDGVPDLFDCAPQNPNRAPGLPEACDGSDTDCDGHVPEDEYDRDNDGFRPCDGDCDDESRWRSPGRQESCDGLDNDCDGVPGPDETDGDGDGVLACGNDWSRDCDDDDPLRYPGAPEVCNGLIDECRAPHLSIDELDLDLDGVLPCAGDDDLLSPTAVVPCAPDCFDGFPSAPAVADALPAIEWVVELAHGGAGGIALDHVVNAWEAATFPGASVQTGRDDAWPEFSPLDGVYPDGACGLPWILTADHTFRVAEQTGAASTGWIHTIDATGWLGAFGNPHFCDATASAGGLVSPGARLEGPGGEPLLAASGDAHWARHTQGHSGMSWAYDSDRNWDVDLTLASATNLGPGVLAGRVSLVTSGNLWTESAGSDLGGSTFSSSGAWSGSATAYPDAPWEATWSMSTDPACDEPDGVLEVILRAAPGGPSTHTGTLTFDGSTSCDDCGLVVLDGVPAGTWCDAVGYTPL